MQTLYFTKQFTKGTLQGVRVNDSISFPTLEGCATWLKAVKAKAAKGKLPFVIVDAAYQNYAR